MKYQIIDADGKVINTINWDGESDYMPPEGCIVVHSEVAGIGWAYANGVFTPPPEDAQ